MTQQHCCCCQENEGNPPKQVTVSPTDSSATVSPYSPTIGSFQQNNLTKFDELWDFWDECNTNTSVLADVIVKNLTKSLDLVKPCAERRTKTSVPADVVTKLTKGHVLEECQIKCRNHTSVLADVVVTENASNILITLMKRIGKLKSLPAIAKQQEK